MKSALTLALLVTFALPAVAETDKLLGAFDYKGGFVENLPLGFKPVTVSTFQLKVPSFCHDVEILGIGASVAGVSVSVESADPTSHVYSVNGGAGSVLDTVTVTLNGPSSLQCAIPVLRTEGSPTPKTFLVGQIDYVHTKAVRFSNPHPGTPVQQISVENDGKWFFEVHNFIARSAAEELKTTQWVTLYAGDRKTWRRPDGRPFRFDTLTLDIWHIAENVRVMAVAAGAGRETDEAFSLPWTALGVLPR